MKTLNFVVMENSFLLKDSNGKPTMPKLKLKQEGRIPLQAKALETEEETNGIAETQLDEPSQDTSQDADTTTEKEVVPNGPSILVSNHFLKLSAELKMREKEIVCFGPSPSQSKAAGEE